MKAISADPPSIEGHDDAGSSSSLSSPSTSDGSLLALGDLTLDRSEGMISPDPPVSELSTDLVTSTPSKSTVTAKRYPSFRDIFMKPLRGRRRSSQLSSSPEDRSEDTLKRKMKKKKKKKKDKMNSSGCAGWLDKKKRRKNSAGEPGSSSSAESSNGSSDQPPPLVTPQELDEELDATDCLQCSRCSRIDGPTGLKGVTYTKRPAGVNKDDESWLCSDCVQSLRRGSSQETDDDVDDYDHLGVPFRRIPPLSHLALNVLIVDVS